jgi:hypothetical protein
VCMRLFNVKRQSPQMEKMHPVQSHASISVPWMWSWCNVLAAVETGSFSVQVASLAKCEWVLEIGCGFTRVLCRVRTIRRWETSTLIDQKQDERRVLTLKSTETAGKVMSTR